MLHGAAIASVASATLLATLCSRLRRKMSQADSVTALGGEKMLDHVNGSRRRDTQPWGARSRRWPRPRGQWRGPPLPAQRRGVCGGTRQGEARRSCRAGGTTDPREPAAASPPAQGSTQGRGAASRPPAGPRTPASPCTSCAVYFNHLPRGRHTWEDPVTRTRPCCSETSRTRGPRGHGWDSAPAAATAQRRALERVTLSAPRPPRP